MHRLQSNFDQRAVTESRHWILDQVPEAVFIIGVDGKINYFNQACVDLAGRTPLIGREAWCAMWRIYDEEGNPVAPEDSAVATTLRTASPMRGGQLTGERPDGTRFQFLYHTTPLFDEGELTGALALLIDITARKEAESKVRELESEIAHLTRVAAMGAMGSVLVHELSQPLTAATSYLASIRRLAETIDGEAGERLRASLEGAVSTIDRASGTLKSVRDMVQRRPGVRGVHSLRELLKRAAQLLPSTLPLRHEIHPDADEIVADRIQLEHVLLNLIRNASDAIQAQPDGSILVTACRFGDMAEICVRDNGPGVSAEARSQLFSPFRTGKSEGLGIGLSICRAIVEGHGGRIWLASGGEGARFCFTIPIEAEAQQAEVIAA